MPRRWRPVILGLIAGGCLLALSAIAASRMTPAWWRPMLRDDPGVMRTAQELENAITTRLYEAHAGETWELRLTDAAASAWMSTRMPRWLASEVDGFVWPADLREPQVLFRHGLITLGARVRDGRRWRVLSASVEPRIDEQGRLWLQAVGVGVGRLRVPQMFMSSALASARAAIPDGAQRLADASTRALAGQEPMIERPSFKLGDGRRVRITAIEVGEGAIVVRCVTERETATERSSETGKQQSSEIGKQRSSETGKQPGSETGRTHEPTR